MPTIVDGEVTSVAFCWQLERSDGGGIALTSHDRLLSKDGIQHDPAPGIVPGRARMLCLSSTGRRGRGASGFGAAKACGGARAA